MLRSRIASALVAVIAATGIAVSPAAAADQETEIIDVPVSFTVQNINRTLNQCDTDGETYTVHGYLTGPAEALAEGEPPVTLYVHGTNTAQWIWRLDVEGRNYVEELAERGHVSVSIDRLGYGENPLSNGFDTCTGANADVAHQVVEQLRAGDYQVDGDAPEAEGIEFPQVFMGGHSSGALVAELVAYSFDSIDGIISTGWAAIGITSETARRFFPMFDTCQRTIAPGAEVEAGQTPGYVYFDQTLDDFYQGSVSETIDPVVREAIADRHVPSPCGVMVSEPLSILEDLTHLADIEVPVHFVFGAEDTLREGVEPYPGLFTGSEEISEITIEDAGHIMLIDNNAELVYDSVAEWLDQR